MDDGTERLIKVGDFFVPRAGVARCRPGQLAGKPERRLTAFEHGFTKRLLRETGRGFSPNWRFAQPFAPDECGKQDGKAASLSGRRPERGRAGDSDHRY